jgi:hypothetical protein
MAGSCCGPVQCVAQTAERGRSSDLTEWTWKEVYRGSHGFVRKRRLVPDPGRFSLGVARPKDPKTEQTVHRVVGRRPCRAANGSGVWEWLWRRTSLSHWQQVASGDKVRPPRAWFKTGLHLNAENRGPLVALSHFRIAACGRLDRPAGPRKCYPPTARFEPGPPEFVSPAAALGDERALGDESRRPRAGSLPANCSPGGKRLPTEFRYKAGQPPLPRHAPRQRRGSETPVSCNGPRRASAKSLLDRQVTGPPARPPRLSS